jgi:hypothetical protein
MVCGNYVTDITQPTNAHRLCIVVTSGKTEGCTSSACKGVTLVTVGCNINENRPQEGGRVYFRP